MGLRVFGLGTASVLKTWGLVQHCRVYYSRSEVCRAVVSVPVKLVGSPPLNSAAGFAHNRLPSLVQS